MYNSGASIGRPSSFLPFTHETNLKMPSDRELTRLDPDELGPLDYFVGASTVGVTKGLNTDPMTAGGRNTAIAIKTYLRVT